MRKARLVGIATVATGAVTVAILLSQRPAPEYVSATVTRGTIVLEVVASGTVTPVGEVKVGSQISGRIAELVVDFNDEVRRGDPLAKLDPSIQSARVRESRATVEIAEANVLIKQAAVRRATAKVANANSQLAAATARVAETSALNEQAKLDLDRKESLARSNTVSQSALGQSRAAYKASVASLQAKVLDKEALESAVVGAEAESVGAEAELGHARAIVRRERAALEQAEEELRRTVVRSPIDGVVIGRDVATGQTVAATLEAPTLFTLASDLRDVEIHAVIDEADIGRIRHGQATVFTVDAYPGRVFPGQVTQIRKAPEDVQSVVTYRVVIASNNPDLALLPGMTAIVRIVVNQASDVLLVPNAALRFQPSADARDGWSENVGAGAVVWTKVDEKELSPIPIETGRSDAKSTEVVSGALNVGDPVVVGQSTAPGRGLLERLLGF